MSARISEPTFLEHLAGPFNIPVLERLSADASGAEIREALKRWGDRGGLDHQDFGSPMDMRIPVDECTILTRPRD